MERSLDFKMTKLQVVQYFVRVLREKIKIVEVNSKITFMIDKTNDVRLKHKNVSVITLAK